MVEKKKNNKKIQIRQCPVCKAESFIKHQHPLYRTCTQCGSLYQYSSISEVTDYYSTHAIDHSGQKGSYEYYISIISRHINFEKDQALIDFGAGDGTFLEICRDSLGLKRLYSIETSEIAKKVLKEKNLDNIPANRLSEIDNKVVTAFQVIEHLEDPYVFARSLNLKKGEHLILTSPAVDSVYCKLYGKRWKSLKPSYHVVLYSKKAVEYLCKKTGLKLLYFGSCFSASNSFFDIAHRYIWALVKFPIKIVLRRSAPFPLFHGKNSFLAVMIKI